MNDFDTQDLEKLYRPPEESHKGNNGKLMVIGGSRLFHAASLWALDIASKIVDMVFYASVPENAEIVKTAKKEFRNGIVIRREDVENYIKEADAILIGPGMLRVEDLNKSKSLKSEINLQTLKDIYALENEGWQTYYLTRYLLGKYPGKKWVIDAGALQMMEAEWLLPLAGNAILTPHIGEFERVKSGILNSKFKNEIGNLGLNKQVSSFAKEYNCIVLLKGHEDIVCSPTSCVRIRGGNAGMTKGGTGDVLAGLVAALSCKNDLWLSARAGSFINKKAGEALFEKVGYYFNSSDLAGEIPRVMKQMPQT